MKFIYEILFATLLGPIIKKAKLELLAVYLRAVDGAREVFSLGVMALFAVMFIASGFVIVHVALFLLMPWSPETNAYVMLGLGTVYVVVPSFVIIRLCSRRTWLNISGAESMRRSISGEGN